MAAKEAARAESGVQVPERPEESHIPILTTEEIKSAVKGKNSLRVVCVSHQGQGAAMNTALEKARAPLIGLSEDLM